MIASIRLAACTIAAGLGLGASLPALAASDYLLQIEDYAGPGKPATIELESWSFGATNPSRAAGSVSVVTARDAGSGMATGRRACATGRHFPKAVLSNAKESWTLNHVTISGCPAGGMSLSYASAAKVTKTRSNIQNN